MRDPKNIADVEELGVDLMGFIFYSKSPRFVAHKPTYMPVMAKRVGVFVNEEIRKVVRIAKNYSLDYLQLHGSESVEYCEELQALGYSLIKAFTVSSTEDILKATAYEHCCEMFIFDTKCSCVGGSGVSFDWSLLEEYSGKVPFLLSGGLGLDNIESIKSFKHEKLIGYDLNSAFEIVAAVKSISKLDVFINDIKDI